MDDRTFNVNVDPNNPVARDAALDARALITARSEATRSGGDFTLSSQIITQMAQKVLGGPLPEEIEAHLGSRLQILGSQLAALAYLAETALRLPSILAAMAEEQGVAFTEEDLAPDRMRKLLFEGLDVERGHAL